MVLVLTASTSFFSYPNRVGPFFGWQMLCDLEESRCLKFDDSFCELGPGAKGKYTIQVVLKLGSSSHSRTFCCSQNFMFQMVSRLSSQQQKRTGEN
jgi:hypothetical protein